VLLILLKSRQTSGPQPESIQFGVHALERFNPATLAMKRELKNGLLGRIYQISTRRVGPFSGRVKDVGVAKDLASHDIDLVGWLSGSKYASLDSRTSNPMGKKHEDLLVAIGTLESGVLVSHQVNWMSPLKERLTSVLGENGLLVADTLSMELFHYKLDSITLGSHGFHSPSSVENESICKFELSTIEPLLGEHLAFQEAIVNGGPWRFASLQEGLDVVKTAEILLGNTRH
jgi:predicted dehydrogenase